MFTSDKRQTPGGDPETFISLLLWDQRSTSALMRPLWKGRSGGSGGCGRHREPCSLPLALGEHHAWWHKLPLCLTPLAASRQDELGAPSSWECICDTCTGKDFQPGIQRHCFCTDPAAFPALLLGTGRSTQRADQYSIPANISNLCPAVDHHFEGPLVFSQNLEFIPAVFRKS